MSAAWMLYLLLVGTLIALAARLLASAMRTFGLPTRWVWAGALAGVVVLAFVAPLAVAFFAMSWSPDAVALDA